MILVSIIKKNDKWSKIRKREATLVKESKSRLILEILLSFEFVNKQRIVIVCLRLVLARLVRY